MRLLKILALLSVPILLVGCPAKRKILYLKVVLGKDLKIETFLKQIGNKIDVPFSSERVGFKFLPDRCEHRKYKSESERALLGSCLIDKEVYIYALVADHGAKPQTYLEESDLKETLSIMNQYKNNLDHLVKSLDIPAHEEGYHVEDKLEFMKMLKSISQQSREVIN